MSESSSDRRGSSTSSVEGDLSNLVIWAHTHGTICSQIPTLEFIQNTDQMNNDNAVLWMCKAGHAYHWHCGKSHNRGEEEIEAVGRGKRLLSSESLARECSFEEKKLKVTPSPSEMHQGDSGNTEPCGRSQEVTEQKADNAYTTNNEPKGSQNTRKPKSSFSAAQHHFSTSGNRVQISEQDVKSESDKDREIIISDDEQCKADEDNQGDRISPDNVSQPSAEELQMHRSQKVALHQVTDSQKAACAPTAKPHVACAYILQNSVSSSEDPSRSTLRLASSPAARPTAETSRARSLPGSAAPRVCLKPLPIPSTEAKAQLESQPSMILFELQATAAVQQLQPSPPERGTLGSSENSAENVGESSETSESGQTPCSSAFWSPESHPPAASNGDVLKKQEKKKSSTRGDIKVFEEWLKLHHPSETCKIHMLPPADLDHYLASFFSSVKKHNGMDFSAGSLNLFRCNINRYLQHHNYQYNTLRAPEFRASQEAYKLKQRYLLQKEAGWNAVEKLTDEDMENLLKKGILSKRDPQGLLYLMFTNFIRGFGADTHCQAYQLYWGQVVLRKNNGEVEYLEWKDDLSPRGNKRKLSRRLFAKPEDPESCPVAVYKEYASKRPPDMLGDHDSLYLSPMSLYSVWDKVWYSRRGLSRGKMAKILKAITQEVRGAVRNTKE
ncbi:hypothetical protein DV515_00015559 [Chloebia gouldiae]|uniref:ZMYM2-like/QRICH1 C-terminal domain-containing protein n=1 Tax=Chloebia gouldiae TaxID=44316 RepID=A0A3L8RV69_CHLGU|nr:hypothetical protein DV515_00015559 [Chloebia gouldiae]